MKKLVLCLTIVGLMIPGIVFAGEEIGSIRTVRGDTFIVRNGGELPGSVGAVVFQKDILKTGPNGSMGVVLKDDTVLSLGAASELSLKEYVFEPKEGNFSIVLRMLKGTFIYMSGVIGKLAPDSILLETPDSTIAVRGTRVLIKVDG